MYVAAVSLLSSSPLSLITAISFQSCLVCTVPQKSHCFFMPQTRGEKGEERNPSTFFSLSSFCLLECPSSPTSPPHHPYLNPAAFSLPRSWWWWWGPHPKLSTLLHCLCFIHLSDNIVWNTELGCIHWVIAVLLMIHYLIYKEVMWTFVGVFLFFFFLNYGLHLSSEDTAW